MSKKSSILVQNFHTLQNKYDLVSIMFTQGLRKYRSSQKNSDQVRFSAFLHLQQEFWLSVQGPLTEASLRATAVTLWHELILNELFEWMIQMTQ